MQQTGFSADTVRRLTAAIAAVRAGVGLTALLAPRRSVRLLGGEASPMTSVALRWFAVREMVMAGTALNAVAVGYPTSTMTRLNVLCDAGDAAAIALFLRRGGRGGVMHLSLLTALTAAGLQIGMARALDEANA